jgi:hypothetical protein
MHIIKMQDDLFDAVQILAKSEHRSVIQQLEYTLRQHTLIAEILESMKKKTLSAASPAVNTSPFASFNNRLALERLKNRPKSEEDL